MNKKGFTLLEIMIVIAILGILSALIIGNFFTSLKKGRDARRKIDLEQIQKSLEMYYEDKKTFPTTLTFGNSLTDPATGKIYMVKLPNDPLLNNRYRYCVDLLTNPTKYQIYAKLENAQDTSRIDPDQLANCTTNCTLGCNYGISSSNTSP